jgi:hypothetical protein
VRALAVAMVGLAITSLYSQGALSSAEHGKAEVVVVGTLYRDFTFPWLDGWNERGHIQIERILKGQIGTVRTLPFAWERDFQPGWCITHPDWRTLVGKRGIWVLKIYGDRYRAQLFSGFFRAEQLNEVLRLLSEPPN